MAFEKLVEFHIDDTETSVDEVVEAIVTFNRVPLDSTGSPLYTDSQWAKMVISQKVVKYVKKLREKKRADDNPVNVEDSIIQIS